MKKTFLLVLSLLTIFIIGGCGDTRNNSSSVATNTSGTTETKMTEKIGDKKTDTFQGKRSLIAYFSRADENYRVGYIEKGNTRILAEMLADMTGGELFEIKTVKPYPKEHDPTIELAKQELADNARPEITGELPKVQDYDLIFLGYPIWWGDLPMAVYTFFDSENFSGKTIAPFCTHEGSGLAGTERFIAEATKAHVLSGLAVEGTVAQNSREKAKEELTAWLKKIEKENR